MFGDSSQACTLEGAPKAPTRHPISWSKEGTEGDFFFHGLKLNQGHLEKQQEWGSGKRLPELTALQESMAWGEGKPGPQGMYPEMPVNQ